MKRVLPVLLVAFLLGGCYTEFLTTKDEDPTDSLSTAGYPPPSHPSPPPDQQLPPPVFVIEVPVPAESPAPAPTQARRDFGSTRGSVQDNMGSSNVGGRTGGQTR